MGFKFLNTKKIEHNNYLVISNHYNFNRENVEFCFQFDDSEPIVFAQGPNSCVITINPAADGNMIFNDNGRVFKIFARERL